MKPFERGFFKDDESIMYPFSQSTVTKTVLYSVGFTIPAVTVICFFFITLCHDSKYNFITSPFCG